MNGRLAMASGSRWFAAFRRPSARSFFDRGGILQQQSNRIARTKAPRSLILSLFWLRVCSSAIAIHMMKGQPMRVERIEISNAASAARRAELRNQGESRMMIAQKVPYEELNNAQKYQRMRPKMLCEVKLISHSGAEPRWVEARIKETNKGGAFCKVVDGHLERFFHWTELRPSAKWPDEDTRKPIATLGEIAVGKFPTLPPPPQTPLPVFAPPVAAPPPLVLLRRDPPMLPSDKNSRTPHPPTDGAGRIITSAGIARALPTRTSKDPR